MSQPDKFAIAAALREIGRHLEVKGENPFKARAYERGARALENSPADFAALVKNGRLTEIGGIGKALAAVIEEIYRSGESALLEQLRSELPPGALELSAIPGLTLKKIAALHDSLRIENMPDLKTACEEKLVRKVKGFGEKAEAKLLAAIEKWQNREERTLLDAALQEAERIVGYLRATPALLDAEAAGALRRRQETVARIVVVAASEAPQAAVDRFLSYPAIARCLERDAANCVANLGTGLTAALHVVAPCDYVSAVHYWTGSRAHYAKLEARALSRGITLGPGRPRAASGKLLKIETERDIYRHLGLQHVPPEQREDAGEVEAAASGKLPPAVTLEAIKGMVHCHTIYSDGQNTIEEMARAAEALGMQYLTITDHSPSAFYARGVQVDRLRAQWEEIDEVQEKVGIKLLKGTESDINEDGSLDYPDFVLERLDVIIASIHTRNKMDREQMTRRLLRALRLPFFKIWGHPLGRLVQSRPPLECDMDEVLDALAASRAAIEVNGDPRRLDLEPRWIRAARQRGIKFVVSTDAHSIRALRALQYGVAMARRGWLTSGEVLNTLEAKSFMQAVHP
jgi:DNA polymerase (family 10)